MDSEKYKNQILLKLAEELFELGNEVMQNVNKDKDNYKKIMSEIDDVEQQIARLREHLFYLYKNSLTLLYFYDIIYNKMKSTDFTKGYDKGFLDAQEKLGLEFNRVLAQKEDLAYEKGFNRGWQKMNINLNG